jgi:hypothetical protein
MAARAAEFRDLLARALVSREPVEGGARLRFEPAAEADVRDLFAREQECCPFWQVAITRQPDAIVVEISGPAEAAPLLAAIGGAVP